MLCFSVVGSAMHTEVPCSHSVRAHHEIPHMLCCVHMRGPACLKASGAGQLDMIVDTTGNPFIIFVPAGRAKLELVWNCSVFVDVLYE